MKYVFFATSISYTVLGGPIQLVGYPSSAGRRVSGSPEQCPLFGHRPLRPIGNTYGVSSREKYAKSEIPNNSPIPVFTICLAILYIGLDV